MNTWTPVQKLSIGAGSALLVVALFGIVALVSISRLSSQQVAVADANDAIAQLDQLLAAGAEAERAGSEFLVTGDDNALAAFDDARSEVEDALDELQRRSEDRPRQRTALDSLGPLLGQRFTTLSAGIAVRRRQGVEAAAEFARADGQRVTRGGMLPIVQRLRHEELRILAARTRLQATHGRTAANVVLVASILALVLAALAFSPARPSMAARLTRRLTTPVGIPSIPEWGDSVKEINRLAGDRLARVQQLALSLDAPATAEAIGDALITRGLGGVPSSASLVTRLDGDVWHVVARRSTKAAVGSALSADVSKPLADAARARDSVVIETPAEREKLYPGLPSLGMSPDVAFVTVPLLSNGRVHGALTLAFDGPRVFGDDERAFLATLGRLGGQALVRIVMSDK